MPRASVGAIWASGNLSVTSSTISGNSAEARGENLDASGGGIWGGNLSVASSTILGNSVSGYGAFGGGISGQNVSVSSSTVSGNSVDGYVFRRRWNPWK